MTDSRRRLQRQPEYKKQVEEFSRSDPHAAVAFKALERTIRRAPEIGYTAPGWPDEFVCWPAGTASHAYLVIYQHLDGKVVFIDAREVPRGQY